MKRFILTLLVALPLVAMAQVKLGVVNSADIFNSMPEKIKAEETLKETSDKLQAEYKLMQDEFNKKYANFQTLASDSSTPETIKERRIQELQEADKKIQAFQQGAAQSLEKQRALLLDPIMDMIQKAIEDVGEEEGMSIVFDISKTPVAYTGPYTEDITPKVKVHLGLQ
ncbi:MAG: OmpH family outer membrane protein [Muribaculaceae bacterium]|nr:OmpH family outer membrane protein [Muribaculaceae bacterium]